MSRQIQCVVHHSPEALERVLQVVRIRGFRLLQLEMQHLGDEMHLKLRLEGERCFENLLKQLQKLVGMQSCY